MLCQEVQRRMLNPELAASTMRRVSIAPRSIAATIAEGKESPLAPDTPTSPAHAAASPVSSLMSAMDGQWMKGGYLSRVKSLSQRASQVMRRHRTH